MSMRRNWLARGSIALLLALAGGYCAAQPADNYSLRQAVMAWDMLAKVRLACPNADDESARLDEMERVAQGRLHVSARQLLDALAGRTPPVLMTAQQARRVVANAGGCDTPRLAQWRGGARWLADTLTQVLAGGAPADRTWPRQPALERPLRITVLGQRKDESERTTVQLMLANPGAAAARVALLESQLFVGLCTKLTSPALPLVDGYIPTQWLDIPARASVSATLVRDPACKDEARVNVGGTAAIDVGKGVRYWRFLVRGVGKAPPPRPPPPDPMQVEPGG